MTRKNWRLAIIVAIIILFILAAFGFYVWTQHKHIVTAQNPASNCSQVNGGGGTITAISGDNITTYDSYANETTTLIIGPYTNYYEPDLLTHIASSSFIAVGQTVSAAGEGCDGSPPTVIDATMGYVWRVPTLPDVPAPDGWYAHRVETGGIVFTKQAQLPNLQATEGYALGEQIDANAVPLDRSIPDWAGLNIGTASGTMGASPASDWGTLDGYQTIKAEISTEADNELIYAIFDPIHYTVYEFTLYPYPNVTNMPIFDEMVGEFAKGLQKQPNP